MTTVLCLRHALAAEGDYPDDKLRPLAEEGRRTAKQVADRIISLGYTVEIVLHSPFLRAEETALIAAERMGAPVRQEIGLGHPFDEKKMLRFLQTEGKGKTVLLVGHNPTLALFADRLLGASRLPFGLGKGECIVVDLIEAHDFGRASFVEMITP